MREGDRLVSEIQLDNHIVLQRVINAGGCPYSLVLLHGEKEIWSAPTSEETRFLCQYFRDRDLLLDTYSDADKVLFEDEQVWLPILTIIEDIKDEIEHMAFKQYEGKETLDRKEVLDIINRHIFEVDRSQRDKRRY